MKPGDTFDTPYETGCTVTSEPDDMGRFLALDSDGVECEYSPVMIIAHYPA